MLFELAFVGGFLAVLVFIHFFVDWIFQSHAEAMVKHNNWKVRAKHCLIYTVGFMPLFWVCNFSWQETLIAANILFWSHFCEDTYIPVYLWAKWIRRPPEMTQPRKSTGVDGYVTVGPPDPKAGFVDFIQTPMGKILMIAIDQIIHICFLIPIAWMMFYHMVAELRNPF